MKVGLYEETSEGIIRYQIKHVSNIHQANSFIKKFNETHKNDFVRRFAKLM